jgi:hypothetical protein
MMRLKQNTGLQQFMIRRDLKNFYFGGYYPCLPGIPCDIIARYDDIVEIEFHHPETGNIATYRMKLDELEKI